MNIRALFFISMCVMLYSCGGSQPDHDPDIETPHVTIPTPEALTFNVLQVIPHDTSAYTQGLEILNGQLYEGTGDYESSTLRKVNAKNGKVQEQHPMGSDQIFGEGITIFNNKIYQLTWQNHLVYVYDLSNINKPIKTLDWPYEGWGITHDSTQLIVSDGSANIYFVDPETFRLKGTVSVKDDQGPVPMLNELEYVDGFIYANIYQTNFIVKVDPASGIVKGKVNLNNLLQETDYTPNRTDVLNGIAYKANTKTFLITGKRWPKMFEMTIK